MDIINACKNSRVTTSLLKMNPFIACFGLLMVFLIVGGVLCHPNRHPINTTALNNPNRQLRLVHVVMRHGIRSPVSLYPKDPYQGNEFLPNGRGQLTMKGIKTSVEFGQFLRQRYDRYLGARFNASTYYAESTGVARAQATLMSVHLGLWPPPAEQRFRKDFAWFPVPVFTTNLDDDMLLLVAKDCPQYNIERQRVEALPAVQSHLALYADMMQTIQDNSGQTMKTFDDIFDIYSTLLAEKMFDLELPQWTKSIFERMEEASAYSFVLKAYNHRMQRFKGGVLLRKLLNDWKSAVDGNKMATRMFLYGGHDSTIANLLSALQIFEPQVPDYGMSIIMELSFDKTTQQYGLEVFTKNSTQPLTALTLPGCATFCPLDDVIRLTASVIPVDWQAECATDDADYTPPPFEGP